MEVSSAYKDWHRLVDSQNRIPYHTIPRPEMVFIELLETLSVSSLTRCVMLSIERRMFFCRYLWHSMVWCMHFNWPGAKNGEHESRFATETVKLNAFHLNNFSFDSSHLGSTPKAQRNKEIHTKPYIQASQFGLILEVLDDWQAISFEPETLQPSVCFQRLNAHKAYGMVWYGMGWYGVVWCGIVCKPL